MSVAVVVAVDDRVGTIVDRVERERGGLFFGFFVADLDAESHRDGDRLLVFGQHVVLVFDLRENRVGGPFGVERAGERARLEDRAAADRDRDRDVVAGRVDLDAQDPLAIAQTLLVGLVVFVGHVRPANGPSRSPRDTKETIGGPSRRWE